LSSASLGRGVGVMREAYRQRCKKEEVGNECKYFEFAPTLESFKFKH